MSDAGKNVVSGSFTASGQSAEMPLFGHASLIIEGGVATTSVQRSTDGGASWNTVSIDELGAPADYTTASDVAFNGKLFESESQVLYRLDCAWTSGTVNYRMAS